MALVGTDVFSPTAGAAYAFVRRGTSWRQAARLTTRGLTANDSFGNPVALAEDAGTALVGDISGNAERGTVYVFTRRGTAWG
jgi:hypothetical protein